MLKGANVSAATGENAVVVGCRKADIIVGPIGIDVADSLGGEVTPKMAVAVGQSDAVRPCSHEQMRQHRRRCARRFDVNASRRRDKKKIGDVTEEIS
jgi:hypothetical protein